MTVSAIATFPSASRPGDRYLLALALVLAGYALLGKGFAYLGVRPLYVGEIVLLSGCLTMLRMGGVLASFASPCGIVLALMMAWTLVRTVPFISEYGADALRDSVIIMYAMFAFVVVSLVLDNPGRINTIVQDYGSFLGWLVLLLPVLFLIGRYLYPYLPRIPGTDVPVLMLGPGEVPVHMAGAAVFAMAGFRRVSAGWIFALAAATAMTSVLTRGGMLAFVVPVAGAALVLGRARAMARTVAIGAALLAIAYAGESAFGTIGDGVWTERSLSAHQIVANVESIFGAHDPNLEGSRQWRLEWWGQIIDETVYGERFWTGRGFGVNLAIAMGYGDPRDSEPLRSPHNANMTILARAGVPGFTLWAVFLVTWAGMIASAALRALLVGAQQWAALFVWIGSYAAAFVINATFDVALEGPMQGVWFWCLIGLGMGTSMIFRCRYTAVGKVEDVA